MTKDELITKQQIEIESLKEEVARNKEACKDARVALCRPEQWSMRCPDFPKVAMRGILQARDAIRTMEA